VCACRTRTNRDRVVHSDDSVISHLPAILTDESEEGPTVSDNAIRLALRQLEQSRTEKLRALQKVAVWRELQKVERGIESLRALLQDESDEPAATPTIVEKPVTHVPEAIPVPDPEGPRGREAIRMLLEEHAGDWLTVKWLTDTMLSRGWVESARPREAVRTSADRLVKDDPRVEKGRGTYRLLPTAPQEDRSAPDL
jgi:hypothetical protein